MKICLSNKGFFSSIKARAASDQVPNPPHVTYCMLSEREFPDSYFCSDVLVYAKKRNEN